MTKDEAAAEIAKPQWQRFFDETKHELLMTDWGGTIGVEDMYQAFRARMVYEASPPQDKTMNKAELKMLEKLFAAQIDAALSKQELRGIVQSKSKLLPKLEAEGFVKRVRRELKHDRFGPIVVEGWELTLAGNAAYCLTCDESEDDSVS